MNFISKVIDIDDLSNIITIPDELKHQKVEIFSYLLKIKRK
jgi:hypothetical protein